MIIDIPYQTLIGVKLLRTRFDKIDRFIRIYNGYLTEYVTLFGSEKYDTIYGRIIYFISRSHISFSLICKNQSDFLWFFAYRKNIFFA